MALYDAADLLATFNRKAARPPADSISDVNKYDRLTKSQLRVIVQIHSVCPKVLYPTVAYGSIPTLATTDNQVFTFGTDPDGYPVFPFGKAGIYKSLNDIPAFPLREGVDYISEGTQIRIPFNNTYSGTLYWYGITAPKDIKAGGANEPALFPEDSRELIAIDAVRQFALEGARNPDLAALMLAEWNLAWPQHCLRWRTQFRDGGALAAYTGRDLALQGISNANIAWAT